MPKCCHVIGENNESVRKNVFRRQQGKREEANERGRKEETAFSHTKTADAIKEIPLTKAVTT